MSTTSKPTPPKGNTSPPALTTRKKVLFSCVIFLIVLAILEVLSYVGIAVLESRPGFTLKTTDAQLADHASQLDRFLANHGNGRLILHDDLGWCHAPNVQHPNYSSNTIAVRGRREYTPNPQPGIVRIAAFGDSLVYGTEVGDEHAWSAQLQAIDPRIEALNYAVGGYGPDQAFMMFEQRGLDHQPHAVILGIADVNYERIVSRYRGFIPGGRPLYKPRYLLNDAGKLSLIPVPLPGPDHMRSILANPRVILQHTDHDWNHDPLIWSNPLYNHVGIIRLGSSLISRTWHSRLRPDRFYVSGQMNTQTEAFPLILAIIREFQRQVTETDRPFTLMIFPTRDTDIWGPGPRVYQPLIDALPDTDILDLADALQNDPAITPQNMRMPNHHYAPNANATVAHAVQQHLIQKGLLPPTTYDKPTQ